MFREKEGEKTESITCHIWEERRKNWGHASIEGKDFYLSLWPIAGTGLTRKHGKVTPTQAILSTFEVDKYSEGDVSLSGNRPVIIPKNPDYSVEIPLGKDEYERVRDKYLSIEDQIKKGSLKYCALNANLPFYGKQGEKAYNCTGILQHVLRETHLPLESHAIMKPGQLARELKNALNPDMVAQKETEKQFQDVLFTNLFT
jgi:hypothetical protein